MFQLDNTDNSVFTSAGINRIRHKRKIISTLYSNGNMSAPELSKCLKISLPTCISLLNELVELGYLKNFGIGESAGGRKPNLYGLPENEFNVIACDFGRYEAKLVIINCYNKFVTPIVTVHTHMDDPFLCEKIFNAARSLMEKYQIQNNKIYGIGVDMPGLIDSKTGINYTIKDKKHQNVGRDLKKTFNKLVFVDNDARMHGYGEFNFGAAKGNKDALIIHWSWGIGLAIIINGQLYNGNNGFAGEFSHIPVEENGELCICGKRGCLETVASFNTLMRKVKQGLNSNEISTLLNHFQNNHNIITPEDVITWARHGDGFCISMLNDLGKAMGKGLSYLIQLLNPEVIVLSGPLSQARQYVMSAIQQSVNLYCIEKISGNTKILISDLGDQSGLIGTSAMMFNKIFNELNMRNTYINENV